MRTLLFGLAAGIALLAAGNARANGPQASCSSCNQGCAKPSFFDTFRGNSCGNNGACGHAGAGCNNNGCGLNLGGRWCAWWKAPCGLDAPTRKSDHPLAFPSHPYIRSPRDYFMTD